MQYGAHRIDWILLDSRSGAVARVGDLISTEAGGTPLYLIVALAERRAWLRNLEDDTDHIMPVGQFHWKALATPA